MSKSNYSSYYQSNARRDAKPYIVDGGCFITQSNTLFVIDPSDMPIYVKCIAKSMLKNDKGASSSGPQPAEPAKEGEASNADASGEVSCCMLSNAKCGMWTVYAVCEDFSPAICFEEEEDFLQPFDEAENSRVLSLVILNSSEIHMNMITPEFINNLKWESIGSEYVPPSPPLPPGAFHKSFVNVYSGQIGIFCQESIKVPSSVTNFVSDNSPENRNYCVLLERIQGWLSTWFSRLVQLTCTGNQLGIMDVVEAPVGVVCASGLGDQGEYEVQIIKDHITHEVYACRIVFMKGN